MDSEANSMGRELTVRLCLSTEVFSEVSFYKNYFRWIRFGRRSKGYCYSVSTLSVETA